MTGHCMILYSSSISRAGRTAEAEAEAETEADETEAEAEVVRGSGANSAGGVWGISSA